MASNVSTSLSVAVNAPVRSIDVAASAATLSALHEAEAYWSPPARWSQVPVS